VYNKVVRFVSIFYRIRHRLSCELSKMMYVAFVYSHLCYGIEILWEYLLFLLKYLIIKYSEYYRMNPIAHMSHNFMRTVTFFQFQNSTVIEFCHWFINLLTITANYLLYFQHILMIINYFMNIKLLGKITSPNWLPHIYWTQIYKI